MKVKKLLGTSFPGFGEVTLQITGSSPLIKTKRSFFIPNFISMFNKFCDNTKNSTSIMNVGQVEEKPC